MEQSKRCGTPCRALRSLMAWLVSAARLNAARRAQGGEAAPLRLRVTAFVPPSEHFSRWVISVSLLPLWFRGRAAFLHLASRLSVQQ